MANLFLQFIEIAKFNPEAIQFQKANGIPNRKTRTRELFNKLLFGDDRENHPMIFFGGCGGGVVGVVVFVVKAEGGWELLGLDMSFVSKHVGFC